MEEYYNKHYIRLDDAGRITHGFSNAFQQPQEGDICINEQGGYQFRLAPGGEENPTIRDMYGVPLYRYDESLATDDELWRGIVRRPDEEVEADRPEPVEPPPSAEQLIAAFMEGAGYAES